MSLGKKLKSVPLVSSAVWHVDHHFEVLHDLHRIQRESGGDMVLAFEALERVLIRLQEVAANTGKAAREESLRPIAGTLESIVAELKTVAGTLQRNASTLESNAATLRANTAALEALASLRRPVEKTFEALGRIESQLAAQSAAFEASVREGFAAQIQAMEGICQQALKPLRAVPAGGLPDEDLEPEPQLLQFLAAELCSPCAVDVGANEGRISVRLNDAGLDVFALEPGPEAFARLQSNLSARPGCRPMQYAAGSFDGEAELHLVADTTADQRYASGLSLYSSLSRHALVEGLAFAQSVRVPVRRLDSLAAEGQIPSEIGILKIDAEGSDLDVIEGVGELRPEIVQVEFWDPAFVFGAGDARNALALTVPALRAMGYRRHIVIGRMPGGPVVYYCNLPVSIPNTWGNAIFFREEASFQAARRWCESSITPAYLYR